MMTEKSAKTYCAETKAVIQSSEEKVHGKKRGKIMGLIFSKSLITNIEIMSSFRLSTMLMKTSLLHAALHDSYEKKGGCAPG